jgi:CelD/BcsL family acetyltransferase involved in cellulose biosynthesis
VPDGLTADTLTTRAEFATLEPEWDNLVRSMARPSPYLLHGWLSAWCRHYAADGALRVHIVRDGGRLVGAFPLFVSRSRGVRVARFLGGRHSALADLILAPGADDAAPQRLIELALGSDQAFADLFGLPGDGPLASLHEAAQVRLIERVEAPVLDLSPGFDAVYTAHTTSKRRNSNNRRLRQLEELGKVEFTTAVSADDLAEALEHAFALHRLRWHGRPDGSDFASDRGMAFQREAIAKIAQLGVPRVVTLRLDDRPIAFHYSFVVNRRMFVHRLAFDPSLARFSPGVLTMIEVFRAAAEEGIERVEYLGGDESYKLEFADRVEPLYQAVGMASNLPGKLASVVQVKAIGARKRLKRSEHVRRLYVGGLGPFRRAWQSSRREAE